MNPGIYDNLNNAEYHGDKSAVSKSGLDLIAKSPAHFQWARTHASNETPAMEKGSLIHTLVLEPEKVEDEYVILPPTIKQRRGKEYDAFLLTVGERKVILATAMAEAKLIAESVRANPVAERIIGDAVAFERSVFAEDFATGVLCKCRPDIVLANAIYDLKTTRNANARSFSYSCRNYRYHVQAAFYTDVSRAAGMDVERFGFIAVDSDTMPYQCTVFHRMSQQAIDQGRAEYRENLETYQRCMESGEWPGYPNEYDELTLAGVAYDVEEMDLEEAA